MKIKRILSTALTVALIFTLLLTAVPVNVFAAHTESSSTSTAIVPEGYTEADLTSAELSDYLDEYLEYNYNSAEEMLLDELEAGYLYCAHSPGKEYTVYVNKYTGFVYYVNNVTGQILTSNPINPGYTDASGRLSIGGDQRDMLMSQISINYALLSDTTQKNTYHSYLWAVSRSQISVSAIAGGIRVNYTLGDTTARFLLPGISTAEHFEENILLPVIEKYESLLNEYCSEELPDENFSFFDNETYIPYVDGCINPDDGKKAGLRLYLKNTLATAKKALGSSHEGYKAINDMYTDIQRLLSSFGLYNPAKFEGSDSKTDKKTLEEWSKKYPIIEDGYAIYVYSGQQVTAAKRSIHNIIRKHCPEYTFSLMFANEKFCGYVDNSEQKPVFRCALEYTFNSDGSLSVCLPASSISFDETVYMLNSINALSYFGTGDMINDGYIFYPDGSGTIVNFSDFYNPENNIMIPLSQEADIYGLDYAYSNINIGRANKEQVTMPVYGIVNEVKANETTKSLTGKDTVTNGFFAIIEEGSSLATLNFSSGGSLYRFASVYAVYKPNPSDEFDLTDTISVGNATSYTMVSESKYSGRYITRYVMLTDDAVGNAQQAQNKDYSFYSSDYVGMATYYRDYLKESGVIEALESISENIPLYIETLGAMDITDKFLSFPVTKTIPLTTFDDVATMFEELSKCEEYVEIKYNEYLELAANEEDENQKYQYEKQAARYKELIGQIENITNINFRLTGYANGGMKATYPTKVKWERACGGKSGFNDLIKKTEEISKDGDLNFAVYPEFDFVYINETAAFDGISNKKHASKMVDNRYASKQIYNAVAHEFESFFTLVVDTDAFEELAGKFLKKYSKYNVTTLSASTLGSDLNSNFDEKAPVNREQSLEYTKQSLEKLSENYELMVDKGNVYALEYATHILNASVDSSHSRFASCTVPFFGMVLHSYVNYSGSPINYSASSDYDMLRSIESGAALYYVLCYQNTSHMKEDKNLNQYYSVDYLTWYDDILTNYKVLNDAIGDLQSYEIVDHEFILAERKIEDKEMQKNYANLKAELIELLDKYLLDSIDATLLTLKGDSENYGKRVKLTVSASEREALILQFAEILNLSVAELKTAAEGEQSFADLVNATINKYEAEYNGYMQGDTLVEDKTVMVTLPAFEYNSAYSILTDSYAQDEDYVHTDYTIDNGNVVLVTYKNGDSVVRFVLNYNNFSVTVKLNGVSEPIVLDAYDFERIG